MILAPGVSPDGVSTENMNQTKLAWGRTRRAFDGEIGAQHSCRGKQNSSKLTHFSSNRRFVLVFCGAPMAGPGKPAHRLTLEPLQGVK